MDVVMLGHSSAGKTTYMCMMYALMQGGMGGFSLRAEDPEHHEELLADAEGIMSGRYPQPSSQRTAFDLYLQYQNKDYFPFTWRDYRGGAVREPSDSEQARQLHEDLRAAGGIVVFCDSWQLCNGCGSFRAKPARDGRYR